MSSQSADHWHIDGLVDVPVPAVARTPCPRTAPVESPQFAPTVSVHNEAPTLSMN